MASPDYLDSFIVAGVQRAAIDGATSGDNTIVAAAPGQRIRVLALIAVMTGTTVTIRFESGAGGTALSGQMQPTQGGGFVLPYNPVGWMETLPGQALNRELSGAQSLDGIVVYALRDVGDL